MLSYVQLQILSNLLKGNSLRYSEVKPKDIDSDLFNYHLRFLLEKKYIKKEFDLYSLTNYGKKYVQQMDLQGNLKDLFKVSVVAIVTRMNKNTKEILMQKRLRHPYYGETLFGISGKVLPGESVEDASSRKLFEETGLKAKFKFVGVERKVRLDKNDKLIEDTLYHVCYSEDISGELVKQNDYGLNFWYKLTDAAELMEQNITFGESDKKLLKRIINKNFRLFYWFEKQTLSTY